MESEIQVRKIGRVKEPFLVYLFISFTLTTSLLFFLISLSSIVAYFGNAAAVVEMMTFVRGLGILEIAFALISGMLIIIYSKDFQVKRRGFLLPSAVLLILSFLPSLTTYITNFLDATIEINSQIFPFASSVFNEIISFIVGPFALFLLAIAVFKGPKLVGSIIALIAALISMILGIIMLYEIVAIGSMFYRTGSVLLFGDALIIPGLLSSIIYLVVFVASASSISFHEP